MERRRLLGLVGGGLAGATAGCAEFLRGPDEESPPSGPGTATGSGPSTRPGTTTGSPTGTGNRPAFQFDTVVDMVADAGCDPNGEQPCDAAVRNAVDHNTLLEFPPGEYLFAEELTVPWVEHFGIAGTGDGPGAVRFRRPRGASDRVFNVRDSRYVLVANLTMDQTDDTETNAGFVVLSRTGLHVEDVAIVGYSPPSGTVDLIADVTRSSGSGRVVRFRSTGGGPVGVYPAGHPVIYSGPQHRGLLQLVDCHVEEGGSGGGGVYASRTRGAVQVLGGLFRNNDVAQIRVAGEGSLVRGARVVVDPENASHVRGTYDTVRGLWWESGWQGKSGGVVEDCEFVAGSVPTNPRALLQIDGTAGAITVRDSSFELDVPGGAYWGVFASPPGVSQMGGPPPRPWDVTLDGVTVAGRAAGTAAVRIDGRPDTRLLDLGVSQRGPWDGVVLGQPHGARIEGGSIRAGRYPLRIAFDAEAGDGCPLVVSDLDRLESRTRDRPEGAVTVPLQDGGAEGVCLDGDTFSATSVAITGRSADGYYGISLDESGE